MKTSIVGGDFELRIPQRMVEDNIRPMEDGYFFSSGRAALYAILQSIKANRSDTTRIYIPDYICPSVPQTIDTAGFKFDVYHINEHFVIPDPVIDSIDFSGSAILLVNYFGMLSLTDTINRIRKTRPDIIVIEDNVQALYEMFVPSKADYRFTSFRKSLPVPDGGWVLTDHLLSEPTESNTFSQYKIAGGLLKGLRNYNCFDDSLYLKMLETGESLIDDNLSKSISKFTLDTFRDLNLFQLKALRTRNAEYLVEGLHEIGIEPMINYETEHTPLFIPIRIGKRDELRKALFAKNIFCPVHWSMPKVGYENFKTGLRLENDELSLIIDHRYNLDVMQSIIDTIREVL